MSKPRQVRLLEASLKNVLSQALVMRRKLSALREQHDLRDVEAFITADEAKALQRGHDAEVRALVLAMANPDKYAAMARLRLASNAGSTTAEERRRADFGLTIARGAQIAAEREQQAYKVTADAITRAGRRRRVEED